MKDERYLLNIEDKMWTDEKVVGYFKEFRKELADIEAGIVERNQERVKQGIEPYTYLLPSKIPIGVTL